MSLEEEIDKRLSKLYTEYMSTEVEISDQVIMYFFRAAYGKGYVDGVEDKGSLGRRYGYNMGATDG